VVEGGSDILVFGLQYDHASQAASRLTGVGPQRFTLWLEKRCGLRPPGDYTPGLRLEVFRQVLKSLLDHHHEAFFARSFEADPFATARVVLDMRDELLLCGWNGKAGPEAPPRLRDLAMVEERLATNGIWPLGWADRHRRLLAKLPFKGVQKWTFLLVEPFDLLPVFWQELLKLLESHGAKIGLLPVGEPIEASSDLGAFQRYLTRSDMTDFRPVKARGDGSLCLFTGRRDAEMASWLAKLLRANPTWKPTLLLPDKTRTLDNALTCEGLPSLGLSIRSEARPAIQLLKLLPAFLYLPTDPMQLLAFLSLPEQPIPLHLSRRLASHIAKTPGTFGTGWQDILGDVAERYPGEWEETKAEYDFWFLRKRYTPQEAIPRVDLEGLLERLLAWIRRDDYSPSKKIIENQTILLLDLLRRIPETHLTRLEITRFLQAHLEPVPLSHLEAQQDHLPLAHHAAAMTGEANDVLWWTFTQKEPDYFFARWYAPELAWMHAENLFPDLPEKENRRITWYRRLPFLKARARLFLFLPEYVESAAVQPFPLARDLEACFGDTKPIHVSLDIHQGADAVSFQILSEFQLPRWTQIQPKPHSQIPLILENDDLSRLPGLNEESFTSLNALCYYPYQWVFKFILKLYKADSQEMADSAQLYGKLAHRLFEWLFREDDAWQLDDTGLVGWIENRCNHLFQEEGATLLHYGREQERVGFQKKCTRAMQRFVRDMRSAGWIPVAAEKSLSGLFSGLPLSGRADLILRRGADYFIIDLKWGGKERRENELKNREDLQLALYRHLLRQEDAQGNIYTGFYLIDPPVWITRDEAAFTPAGHAGAPADSEEIYVEILEKLRRTLHWRRAQIASGKVEIRREASVKALDDFYGSALEDLMEPKRKDAPFDDFRNLINWPT